mmetsp:Transcript_18666/g.36585  ORF Transcript_18666/g.36585 Transcript_18666/m.36585 type:complete len:85 (-) Transcript_18666:542-796(-)
MKITKRDPYLVFYIQARSFLYLASRYFSPSQSLSLSLKSLERVERNTAAPSSIVKMVVLPARKATAATPAQSTLHATSSARTSL